MRYIRNNYDQQMKMYEDRIDSMKKALLEQKEYIDRLLMDKKSDRLKIRELERNMSMIITRYVKEDTDVNEILYNTHLDTDHIEDEINNRDKRINDMDMRLDNVKTEESGEEILLENAYLSHECM